jgi:hypothetical protein
MGHPPEDVMCIAIDGENPTWINGNATVATKQIRKVFAREPCLACVIVREVSGSLYMYRIALDSLRSTHKSSQCVCRNIRQQSRSLLQLMHYRRARELMSWESLDLHGFNVASSVRDGASKPPSGEVFAVITPGEEPLHIRPDVACRVVPKGSSLALSMMVKQLEAIYATFSEAQKLARYILDKMNTKSSSSSAIGWIPQTRKYSSTFRSFLDTTQYDLAGRPIPPSQQLGGPRVTSGTATFRPIGGMINQTIRTERDEAPPLNKSKWSSKGMNEQSIFSSAF